jgi:hypothetical protein
MIRLRANTFLNELLSRLSFRSSESVKTKVVLVFVHANLIVEAGYAVGSEVER